MRILLQTFLRKTYMHPTSHPFQVQIFISHQSVLVKHLVELTQLEKDQLIEVFTLYPPVLPHCLSYPFHRIGRKS